MNSGHAGNNNDTISTNSGSNFYMETYILEHMQSNKALFIVLSLVVTTTVLAIMQLTNSITFSHMGLHAYYAFDLFVSAVFMADLVIRYTCLARIHSDLFAFFYDIFNVLDTLIVLMDIILLSIGGFDSNSFAFTKGLKYVLLLLLLFVVES